MQLRLPEASVSHQVRGLHEVVQVVVHSVLAGYANNVDGVDVLVFQFYDSLRSLSGGAAQAYLLLGAPFFCQAGLHIYGMQVLEKLLSL